jgi:hypothetical protein
MALAATGIAAIVAALYQSPVAQMRALASEVCEPAERFHPLDP